MTIDEFNIKWNNYKREGFYGLDIEEQPVVDYLDNEFKKEVKTNPDFMFSQIKIKFNSCRIYALSDKIVEWQDEINRILNLKPYI